MATVQQPSPVRRKPLPPLQNGDHLDQKTFHERYEAIPEVRAQLIGGIVYLTSRRNRQHGRSHVAIAHWLDVYEEATPGTEALAGATDILGPESEPEPDGFLIILPEFGGQTWEDERGYVNGPPEWIGEIADSSESFDLHSKKRDYEQAGVREYMVAALRQKKLFWFVRRRGKFKELTPGDDGIYRSEAFPGLWLDSAAFLRHDRKRLLAVLRQGLASPEHAVFLKQLAGKRAVG
jgi:hypothetical protein